MRPVFAVVAANPRHVLAIALASGLAVYALSAVWLLAASIAVGLFLLAAGSRSHVAISACALMIAGGAIGQVRVAAIDADPLAAVHSAPVTLGGELIRHPRAGRFGSTLRVRVRLSDGRRQSIEVRTTERPAGWMTIGAELVATGRLVSVAGDLRRGGGSAQYARYLLREGVRQRLVASAIGATGTRRGGLAGLIDRVRVRAERTLEQGLPAEPGALLRGMVLGGDRGLTEATVEDFRTAGLSHILAVSGQNILLIVLLVRAIAMACGAGYRGRIVLPVLAIVVYVPLCGAQPSVIRAGVMGLAALAAVAASRPASRVYALALAAIVMLAWNPRATADVGAQLSFAAVLGIMAFTGPVSRALCRRFPSLPMWVAEAFAATVGATLATAPLMAWHFDRVSLVSLIANVLATPLIGVIVWLGSLAAAVGQVSAPLGGLLNAPNAFVLGALIEIAKLSAAVPGAEAEVENIGLGWLLASIGSIVALAAIANGLWSLPGRTVERVFAGLGRGGARAVLAVGLGLAVLILLLARAGQGPNAVRPSVTMLDVGQGDAMLLRGAGGCDALIDAGPDPELLASQLKRHQVDRLDLLLITHSNADHFAGLAAIASGSPVPRVVINGGGLSNMPSHQTLVDRLASRGALVERPTAGLKWQCGDLALDVLAPTVTPADGTSNESSAVVEVHAGPIRVFAGGDAEGPPLLAAARREADVLKVSHHGSADPALGGLLARLRPQIGLIGVGADNTYGHPTPQTISALSASGVRAYRTDRDGNVTVSVGRSGELVVSTDGPGH